MSQTYRFTSFLIFIVVLGVVFSASGQEPKSPFWSNVHFGGGIGLGFANQFFSATLAPSAIYDVNEQFSVGVGLNGTYASQKNVYNSTILGGSVLGLFNVIPEIQLSAEFEELNVSRNFKDNLFLDDNYWYPALFLGAGYRSQNVTIGLRYDVLYDVATSVYGNAYAPFVRVYF